MPYALPSFWHNPPTLSWLGTGTKYAGWHTQWLGRCTTWQHRQVECSCMTPDLVNSDIKVFFKQITVGTKLTFPKHGGQKHQTSLPDAGVCCLMLTVLTVVIVEVHNIF